MATKGVTYHEFVAATGICENKSSLATILDHAPWRRVAWVRDLFERIEVDSNDENAVAVWSAATDEGGVSRSDSENEWLRR